MAIFGDLSFDVDFFTRYLFNPPSVVWKGLWLTIVIALVAQTMGVAIGLLVALMRLSRIWLARQLAVFYIWVWRGTPVLVQLLIIYTGVAASGLYKYPDLSIGPLTINGPMQAALLTLSLNEAAYMAEIFRAAIQSIDKGQFDAARAIGMRSPATMRFIILPQAARIVLPPLGNEFTLMIKGTSLLSVIGIRELFGTMQNINAATFRTFELFLVAAIWYLILTTLMSLVQKRIEDRYSRHELPAERAFKEKFKGRSLLSGQR
jgi:polar amino acid transport system permease protein